MDYRTNIKRTIVVQGDLHIVMQIDSMFGLGNPIPNCALVRCVM
jgi:hypothetical protein